MQLGEEELAEPLFDYYDYGCLTLLLKVLQKLLCLIAGKQKQKISGAAVIPEGTFNPPPLACRGCRACQILLQILQIQIPATPRIPQGAAYPIAEIHQKSIQNRHHFSTRF